MIKKYLIPLTLLSFTSYAEVRFSFHFSNEALNDPTNCNLISSSVGVGTSEVIVSSTGGINESIVENAKSLIGKSLREAGRGKVQVNLYCGQDIPGRIPLVHPMTPVSSITISEYDENNFGIKTRFCSITGLQSWCE